MKSTAANYAISPDISFLPPSVIALARVLFHFQCYAGRLKQLRRHSGSDDAPPAEQAGRQNYTSDATRSIREISSRQFQTVHRRLHRRVRIKYIFLCICESEKGRTWDANAGSDANAEARGSAVNSMAQWSWHPCSLCNVILSTGSGKNSSFLFNQ